MSMPTVKDVHQDAVLSSISSMHSNQAYIADRMFQSVPVMKKSDNFYKFLKGAWFRNEAGVRGPGGSARVGGYKVSTDSYACVEYAFAHKVPIEVINNADDPLRPLATGARFATDKILLAKEVIASTLMTTSGNWTSSEDAEGKWVSTEASNTFLTDMLSAIDTVRELIGVRPNVLVCDADTWRNIKQIDDVIDRIKYTGTSGAPAAVTRQTIASLFELDEVLVGDALYSDAEEVVAGTDFNAVQLFETNAGKGSAFLYFRPPSPGIEIPAAAYTFNWANRSQGADDEYLQSGIREVRRWWEKSNKSWFVEASECFDIQVVSADAGFLFTDTLAT